MRPCAGCLGREETRLECQAGKYGFYPAGTGESLEVLEQGSYVGLFYPSWVSKSSSPQQGEYEEGLGVRSGWR